MNYEADIERAELRFLRSLAKNQDAIRSLKNVDQAFEVAHLRARLAVASMYDPTAELNPDEPANWPTLLERYRVLHENKRRRQKLQREHRRFAKAFFREARTRFVEELHDLWHPSIERPPQITLIDLKEEAIGAVEDSRIDAVLPDGQVDYRTSLDDICYYLAHRCRGLVHSRPRPVAMIRGKVTMADLPESLWANDHCDVRVNGLMKQVHHRREFVTNPEPQFWFRRSCRQTLHIQVCGYFTRRALHAAADDIASSTRAILSLFSVGLSTTRLPILSARALHAAIARTSRLLGVLYGPPAAKSDLEGQISSCVRLVREAERQDDIQAYVALATAALEALLAPPGGASISQALAETVAVLLEPDVHRRANAEKCLKELYAIRSRVVHGTAGRVSASQRPQLRTIVRACLVTMLDWQSFVRKSGLDSSTQAFHNEVKQAKYAAAPFGVSPADQMEAQSVWRNPAE